MEDGQFEKRLRCAVAAGWWTALVGVIWVTLAWFWWLAVKSSPGLTRFAESMWGGVWLADMEHLVWCFFGLMKLVLFVWVLVTICLTIWSRKLRKG